MATPQCMSNDGNRAVFVGTWLEVGEAVTLCSECLVPWSAALLNTITGINPEPFLRAVSEGGGDGEGEVGDTLPAGGGFVPQAAQGAPTDEPPAPAPADEDTEARVPPAEVTPVTGHGQHGSADPPTGTENPAAGAPATDENTGDAA